MYSLSRKRHTDVLSGSFCSLEHPTCAFPQLLNPLEEVFMLLQTCQAQMNSRSLFQKSCHGFLATWPSPCKASSWATTACSCLVRPLGLMEMYLSFILMLRCLSFHHPILTFDHKLSNWHRSVWFDYVQQLHIKAVFGFITQDRCWAACTSYCSSVAFWHTVRVSDSWKNPTAVHGVQLIIALKSLISDLSCGLKCVPGWVWELVTSGLLAKSFSCLRRRPDNVSCNGAAGRSVSCGLNCL